jgi:epoxyqueuosine reductase
VCPWNRFARPSAEPDFAVRHGLDSTRLVELFAWTQSEFHERLAGSAIHRIGYERWLRNLAVGIGNALKKIAGTSAEEGLVQALEHRREHPSALVREHVYWALSQRAAHAIE